MYSSWLVHRTLNAGTADDDAAGGFEQAQRVAQRGFRMLEMLEHVEHQHQAVAAAHVEGLVERSDVNSVVLPVLGRHDLGIAFDTFDKRRKPGEFLEEKAVTTADVEDPDR